MAVTYFCDICKKKAEKIVIVMAGSYGKSPYRHFCRKCWNSVEEFLEKREKPKKKMVKLEAPLA